MIVPALSPSVQAQDLLLHDLAISNANVKMYNDTRALSHFAASGSTVRVSFMVVNTGSAVSGVPIWARAEGVTPGACWSASFGAQNSASATQHFNWTISTNALTAGQHNVTITVNRDKPTGTYTPTGGTTCPTASRDGPLDGETAPDDDNNQATTYFVVDLKPNLAINSLLWCRAGLANTCTSPTEPITGEDPVDFTQEYEGEVETHFVVDVINNGTWGTYDELMALDWHVNVTVVGPGINGTMNITRLDGDADAALDNGTSIWWRSTEFDLVRKTGNYTVTARIVFPEDGSTLDNRNTTEAYVRYSDFIISYDENWATNASSPLEYVANNRIRGNISFTNVGERNISSVSWRIYLDDGTKADFVTADTTPAEGGPAIPGGATIKIPIDWDFHTDAEVANFLRPGIHYVNAIVDIGDKTYELNEQNNTLNFSIFIRDDSAPVFTNTPAVAILNLDNESITATNPSRPFKLYVYAADDDQASVTVRANFTNADENITRHYDLVATGLDGGRRYVKTITDLPFISNWSRTSTNWNLTVTARDGFGNNRTVSGGTLRMDVWPLHTVPIDYLVRNETDGANFTWAGPESPIFQVMLRGNMTGMLNQEGAAPNLVMSVKPPRGEVQAYDNWTRTECAITEDPNPVPDDPTQIGKGRDDISCPDMGIFSAIVGKQQIGSPGMWYANITINDISGMKRFVNRTFNVTDELPVFFDVDVLDRTINASEALNFTADVSEDYERDDLRVFVNLTRNDGKSWNFTMGEGHSGSSELRYKFYLNVTTGRKEMLDHAGKFNLTFWAVDFNNNWAKQEYGSVEIVDAVKPTILEAGAITLGDKQELDTPISFYAKASDETNLTLELRVKPKTSSEIVIGPVNLTDNDGDENWTYAATFANEGEYEWQIRAIDSVGQVSDPIASGPISIQRNLAPRVAVISPSHHEAGDYYSVAKPRITIYLQDRDGIDNNTLTLKIDGKDAVYDLVRDADTSEYQLTARVDKTYLHGARIPVNLTVVDSSADLLPNWLNFTIIVDATAPVVRVPQFEPKYRANQSDPWVVSLDTRFTLSAHDDDDIDETDIASIRYSVYRVGQFSPLYFWEGAPFRLSSLDRFTPLPGKYTMTILAEDDVGNFNDPAFELDIVLDSAPPSIANFGEKPDGRDIRLTLRDATGVNRAVLYHRINNGAYETTPMTREGDVWSAQLPEGRKGDKITYYVQAWDQVENTVTYGSPEEPYDDYDVPNHKPTLKILAPQQGEPVQRTVEVRWDSVDLDADALTFKLLLRGATETSFDEIIEIESPGTRRFAFDTTKFPDGEHVLRIEVQDGSAAVTADVTFTIRNKASAIGTVGGGGAEILPGEGLLVTAEITKAAPVTVEARVYDGDRLVGSFAMRDDGKEPDVTANDRVWSGLVKADDAGDYRVEIFTVYREDGLEKNDTAKNAAYFSVAMTPGYILTQYAPLVALVAIAAAVAVGVAGWVAFRKRR